jgi:hypothetical protein
LEFPFEETDGLEPGNENEAAVEEATDGLNVSVAGTNVKAKPGPLNPKK